MREIIFSVRGNQKDREHGNPIPYKRTLAGKFRKDSTDYMAWKEYVRAEFDRTANFRDDDGDNKWTPYTSERITHKGIVYPTIAYKGERVRVETRIEFADDRRGDCDNIHKGILDALFADDKCVWAGEYEGKISSKKRGHVGITILVEPEER